MGDLGSISLSIALALAGYSTIGSILGKVRNVPSLVESARYAVYLLVLVLAVAVASLVGAFLSNDFELQYVYAHSSLAMPRIYMWVAFYAGNEGSLLFIAFALSVLSAAAMFFSPQRMREGLPYANTVMMLVLTFFIAVMMFMADPFARLSFVPVDGEGINPLLTHPGMFIHPPIMMTGLIAVTLPFAFAMGALLAGKTGDEWVDGGRTWGIISWVLLGSGLLLGGWWAYTILGWGGYWAWDPVENAGFMPFVGLTAFIHSIMVQKRRGMFRMWNIVLINLAFGLALYGMFMNRGGPVPSVHSFGASNLGWVFLMFTLIGVVVPFALFFFRYGALKSARSLDSTLSREAAFLVNNLLLLAIAFVTLWGVVYPLISELFRGATVTVGAPFYNQVNGPLFLALIFLMGVGPLLPWRQASMRTLGRTLLVPGSAAVVVTVLLVALGVRKPYAVAALGLCALVAAGILLEWARGTRSRHRQGDNYAWGFAKLIAANRPRYGGYVVHLGRGPPGPGSGGLLFLRYPAGRDPRAGGEGGGGRLRAGVRRHPNGGQGRPQGVPHDGQRVQGRKSADYPAPPADLLPQLQHVGDQGRHPVHAYRGPICDPQRHPGRRPGRIPGVREPPGVVDVGRRPRAAAGHSDRPVAAAQARAFHGQGPGAAFGEGLSRSRDGGRGRQRRLGGQIPSGHQTNSERKEPGYDQAPQHGDAGPAVHRHLRYLRDILVLRHCQGDDRIQKVGRQSGPLDLPAVYTHSQLVRHLEVQ